jgi:hypothetical protein
LNLYQLIIKIERVAAIVVFLTLLFIAMFAIGLGPNPYVYPNEVFTIDARPAGVSISMFACWVCNTCKSLSPETCHYTIVHFFKQW